MRTLYTVAYPELGAEDRRFIEAFRQVHDLPYRDVVAAHFTMVFGVADLPDEPYESHVRSVAETSEEISFTCRYAMLGAGDDAGSAHVFLVPDEGYSSISLLHDRLYEGPLERFHRLDRPYIPHITIGTLADRRHARALCAELNQAGLSIAGRLRQLTVGALQDGRFTHRLQVPIGAA